MNIDVHFLPSEVTAAEVAGRTVVVMDVLRATTTMVQALWSGAREIIPCLEIDEAKKVAKQIGGEVLLGGERGGTRIDGFDLGNSPAEYTSAIVRGRTIVMTTTNGTRAMRACRSASRLLIGSFLNLSVVIDELIGTSEIAIVCAGTDGRVTREDVLLTGSIIQGLDDCGAAGIRLNDEGELALSAWRDLGEGPVSSERLATAMRHSRGGRNLIELGFAEDIAFAAQIDTFPTVVELLVPEWRIVRR